MPTEADILSIISKSTASIPFDAFKIKIETNYIMFISYTLQRVIVINVLFEPSGKSAAFFIRSFKV